VAIIRGRTASHEQLIPEPASRIPSTWESCCVWRQTRIRGETRAVVQRDFCYWPQYW